MKKEVHPKYYDEAKVICACGNRFVVGSTIPEIHVEICSHCHPFFTGKQKLIDSARRIEKFKIRSAKKSNIAGIRLGKNKKAKIKSIKIQKPHKLNT